MSEKLNRIDAQELNDYWKNDSIDGVYNGDGTVEVIDVKENFVEWPNHSKVRQLIEFKEMVTMIKIFNGVLMVGMELHDANDLLRLTAKYGYSKVLESIELLKRGLE